MKIYYLLMSIFCFFLASCQEEFMEESVKSQESENVSDAVSKFEQEALRKGIENGDIELPTPTDSILPTFTLPESKTRAFDNLKKDTRNWMSHVDGDRLLTELNMPGTHNSAADCKGQNNCQNKSITQQLEWGVRVLDIRCRHVNNAFFIHHDRFYQNKTFGSVMEEITSFLSKNPSETVIMLVKEEYNAAETSRSFDETFEWYMNDFRWNNSIWRENMGSSPGTPQPRSQGNSGFPKNMDAARGKIIPICRFNSSRFMSTSWSDNCTFSSSVGGVKMRVQDSYFVSTAYWMDWKWTQINNLFEEARFSGLKDVLYINYLSGSSLGLYPWDCAHGCNGFWGMNYQFYKYCDGQFLNRRLGIVMQDFCQDDYHTDNIIRSNTFEPLDVNQATAREVSSQETVGENGRAENALDGNPNTWWHTQYTGNYSWDRKASVVLRYPTVDNRHAISITHRPNITSGRPIMFSVETLHGSGRWDPVYIKPSRSLSVMLDAFKEGEQIFYFDGGSWPTTDYRVTFHQSLNDVPYLAVSEIKIFKTNGGGGSTDEGNEPAPSKLIVKGVSSQETVGEDGRAENAIDGNPNTWWHTQYTGNYPWDLKANIRLKYPTPSKFNSISITHRPNTKSGRPLWFYVEYLYEDGNWVKLYMKPSWASSWATQQLLDVNSDGEQTFSFNNSWPATDYRVTFEQTMDNTRYTFVSEIKFKGAPEPPKEKPTVKAVSSQETVGENGRAENAIDGNPKTWWHTQYTGNYSWNKSASITLKYKTKSQFKGISITHRPDIITGRPLEFFVEVYDNSTGSWRKMSFQSSGLSAKLDPALEGEQTYHFQSSLSGTEYRVTFERTMDNREYTHVSEIKLF